MNLQQLQTQFLNNILHPSSQDFDLIEGTEKLNSQQRLFIYAEAYQLQLIEALMDTYPAVHTLLGDEDFEALGREYLQHHPSQHFSLRYFGDKLVFFLQQHKPWSDSEFLAEMANFEWQLRHAFDATDATPLSRDELLEIEAHRWPDLQFSLHHSFSMINFNWNTPVLWKAIIQDAPPRPPEPLDATQQWIIWRPQLETQFRSIDTLEALLLKQLQQQISFSELCDFISLETGSNEEQIAINHLGRWVDEGLLLSFNR